MIEDSGPDEHDPNRRALESIDAVHAADPETLNEQVARLRRFIRIRRPLYYSILAPFGALSRLSTLLVLTTGAAALFGVPIAILAGAPGPVTGVLIYWGVGAAFYHLLSVLLSARMTDAATSVGLSSEDLLAMWMR